MNKHSTSMLGLLEARNDARAELHWALASHDASRLERSGPRHASALRALDEAGERARYAGALSPEDRAAIDAFLEERKRDRLERERAAREKVRREAREPKPEAGRAAGDVQ